MEHNSNVYKNIWILHHYGTPPSLTGLTRPYCFGKYLIRAGHQCKVFAASFQHYAGYNLIEGKERYIERNDEGVPFIYVRTLGYEGSGIARVKNMVSFYFGVKRCAKELAKRDGKPDVILASTPHPLTCLAGLSLAKRFGCKCIVEVRDLWPESFVAYGIIGKNNPLLSLMYAGEKWLYKKADKLIFTMEGGKDYIIEKGWDKEHGGSIDLNKVYHINNGVDLEVYDYNREHYTIEDEDLDDPDTFKVIYTGSIRRVNHVGTLLETAGILERKKLDQEIKMIIYGDGDEREALEREAKEKGIKSIVFKGRVDKKYISHILSNADATIIHGDSKELFRFGASPNKLFDYFAAGKPVIADFKMNYDLIEKYDCGIVKPNNTPQDCADAILQIANLSNEEYSGYCDNVRKAAQDYDFKILTGKLIKIT